MAFHSTSFIEIREDCNDKVKQELLQINKSSMWTWCKLAVWMVFVIIDINADQNEQMDEHVEEEI